MLRRRRRRRRRKPPGDKSEAESDGGKKGEKEEGTHRRKDERSAAASPRGKKRKVLGLGDETRCAKEKAQKKFPRNLWQSAPPSFCPPKGFSLYGDFWPLPGKRRGKEGECGWSV